MFLTTFEEANRGLLIVQGIYDILPVALFMIGSVILLRSLYGKMVKGCYCLLAAGSIMVFSAGLLKAFHKIFMGMLRIDYVILDKQFTPTQSIGFLLLFLALIGMFTSKNKDHVNKEKLSVISLPLFILALDESVKEGSKLKTFSNPWPFLSLMIIGAAGFLILLILISIKMKLKIAPVLFGLSVLFMIGMGYLSTMRTFEGAWMQISCNVLYQSTYMAGCLLLKKNHLDTVAIFNK